MQAACGAAIVALVAGVASTRAINARAILATIHTDARIRSDLATVAAEAIRALADVATHLIHAGAVRTAVDVMAVVRVRVAVVALVARVALALAVDAPAVAAAVLLAQPHDERAVREAEPPVAAARPVEARAVAAAVAGAAALHEVARRAGEAHLRKGSWKVGEGSWKLGEGSYRRRPAKAGEGRRSPPRSGSRS